MGKELEKEKIHALLLIMGCAAVFMSDFPEVSWRRWPKDGCLRESLWPWVIAFSHLCDVVVSPHNILSPLLFLAPSHSEATFSLSLCFREKSVPSPGSTWTSAETLITWPRQIWF